MRNGGRHHRRRGHAGTRVFPQRLRPCRAPRDDVMRCGHCCHRTAKANRAKGAEAGLRAGQDAEAGLSANPLAASAVGRDATLPWKVSTGRRRQLPRSRRAYSPRAPTRQRATVRKRFAARIEGNGLMDDAHDMESPASLALSTMNGRPTSITSSGRSATGRHTARPEAISGARWTKLSSVKVPS